MEAKQLLKFKKVQTAYDFSKGQKVKVSYTLCPVEQTSFTQHTNGAL